MISKGKTLVFIAILIALPIIRGEAEIPDNITTTELIAFAKQIWTFWSIRLESIIPTVMGLFS